MFINFCDFAKITQFQTKPNSPVCACVCACIFFLSLHVQVNFFKLFVFLSLRLNIEKGKNWYCRTVMCFISFCLVLSFAFCVHCVAGVFFICCFLHIIDAHSILCSFYFSLVCYLFCLNRCTNRI